jgi:hypothetical protein
MIGGCVSCVVQGFDLSHRVDSKAQPAARALNRIVSKKLSGSSRGAPRRCGKQRSTEQGPLGRSSKRQRSSCSRISTSGPFTAISDFSSSSCLKSVRCRSISSTGERCSSGSRRGNGKGRDGYHPPRPQSGPLTLQRFVNQQFTRTPVASVAVPCGTLRS